MAKNIDSKKDLRKWVESLETDIDLLADLVDYLINAYYDSDAEMGERFDDFRSSVLRQWAESQEDPAWDLLESAFGVRSEQQGGNWVVSLNATAEFIVPISGVTNEEEACAKAEQRVRLLNPENWSMTDEDVRINCSMGNVKSRFALPQ